MNMHYRQPHVRQYLHTIAFVSTVRVDFMPTFCNGKCRSVHGFDSGSVQRIDDNVKFLFGQSQFWRATVDTASRCYMLSHTVCRARDLVTHNKLRSALHNVGEMLPNNRTSFGI